MKKNLITNKIGNQLILAIVISLIIACAFFLIMLKYIISPYIQGVGSPYDDITAQNRQTVILIILLIIGITVITVILFIISFLLFVNKKVKYLKYITKQVKRISDEDFGSKIEVKGNDELAQLCASINSMSTQLKSKFDSERELENTKNELITNMSHDLRSPLTSIIGYADLIRRKAYKGDKQLNEFAEVTYSKCERLKKLIDELFEYTKLNSEGTQLKFNKVNLSGLLAQLIGEYILVFDTEGLSICTNIPEEDITVNADIEKIVRVFDNILINAIKYSVKPSEVVIQMHKDETSVVVSISNKVENLRVDNLEKLFERFYRADKSRNEDGGTGIGLAIAKRIVELHQGKIWAEYNENNIVFNVELVSLK